MCNKDSYSPQLYTYSWGDDITPFEPLDGLLRQPKETVGDDCGHCGHLADHRKKYWATVERVLDIVVIKAVTRSAWLGDTNNPP